MIDLIFAAALAQGPARPAPPVNPCNAVATLRGADCPRWRSLARSQLGELLLDPASPRREGMRVGFHVRLVYNQDRDDGVRIGDSLQSVDCAAGTMGTDFVRNFAADGRQMGEAPQDGAQEPVQPGTLGGDILDELCRPPAAPTGTS